MALQSGPTIQVRVRIRDDCSNLFVRLAPSTIAKLLQSTLQEAQADSSGPASPSAGRNHGAASHWELPPCIPDVDCIEFLPIAVMLRVDGGETEILHVSFNGGLLSDHAPAACQQSARTDRMGQTVTDVMEMPRSLLPALRPPVATTASIRVLRNLSHAVRVTLEPRTAKDWHLVQTNASALEGGALLSQISLISRGQLLQISTSKYSTAQFITTGVSITPRDADDAWPSNHVDPLCALLVQDTEVIVAPKQDDYDDDDDLHGGIASADMTNLRILPARGEDIDFSDFDSSLEQLRPPPYTVVLPQSVHAEVDHHCDNIKDNKDDNDCAPPLPITWAHISKSRQSATQQNDSGKDPKSEQQQVRLVRVQYSSKVPRGHAVLCQMLRTDLGLRQFYDTIQIKIVSASSILLRTIDEVTLERVPPSAGTTAASTSHADINGTNRKSYFQPAVPTAAPRTLQTPAAAVDTDTESSDAPPDTHEEMIPLQCIIPIHVSGACHYFRCTNDKDADTSNPDLIMATTREIKDLAEQCIASTVLPSARSTAAEITATGTMNSFEDLQPDFILTQEAFDWGYSVIRQRDDVTIIHGPNGSGKTTYALLIAALARSKHQRSTIYLDCKRLHGSINVTMADILEEFRQIVEQAKTSGPCIICLDDLDCLAPHHASGENAAADSIGRTQQVNPQEIAQSNLIADHLVDLVRSANRRSPRGPGESETSPSNGTSHVSLLITCSKSDGVNGTIQSSLGPMFSAWPLPSLTHAQRLQLLRHMSSHFVSPAEWNGVDATDLAMMMDGYRCMDLRNVATRVEYEMRAQKKPALITTLTSVLKQYMPLSHLALDADEFTTSHTWKDIGGLHDVRKSLIETVMNPIKYRLIYEQVPVRLPRGILLYGPPGCGKSYLVPALAKHCSLPLIISRGPEVLDKYIGASEARIRELFERAASVAPSILFFDEFDSIAPHRGSDHTGVTDRVVNQLLTFLDGVEDAATASGKQQVYIIATSSRPDKIDPALLRPGRLEKHLYVGLPASLSEWCELYVAISQSWQLATDLKNGLEDSSVCSELSSSVPHFFHLSAADVRNAFRLAHVNALNTMLESAGNASSIERVEISRKQLIAAVGMTRPSLTREDANAYSQLNRPFLSKAAAEAIMRSGGYSVREEATNKQAQSELRTTLR